MLGIEPISDCRFNGLLRGNNRKTMKYHLIPVEKAVFKHKQKQRIVHAGETVEKGKLSCVVGENVN